jgi:two-component system nitrogen regulation sensor histidine kinase NtrY
MPKPVFRTESLVDIVRQAVFLHEVAHPEIRFSFSGPEEPVILACDRRQLGQAFTNILKNAIEAIEDKINQSGPDPQGEIAVKLEHGGNRISVTVGDNGIGLPADRERLTEPYITTRVRGTGLGLAIVKNILEEHHASISFADRPGGGTVITIMFDPSLLTTDSISDPTTSQPVDAVGQRGQG